jgi:hypothetical protein
MVIGEIKKIGIALAAYEPNPKYFSKQLESIQKQSFSHWICVVTFDSPVHDILNHPSIEPFKSDERFLFIENASRLGHKKNFEKALRELLSFELDAIAFSDQDDVWYPEKLKTAAESLSNQPRHSLVHSDMHLLSEQGLGPETAWCLERRGVTNVETHHLLVRNVVAGCALLMDVQLAKNFPNIPDGVEFHDHWYALVASNQGKVIPIMTPLYAYRQHGNNVVAVSPYRGRFAVEAGSSLADVLAKAKRAFLRTRSLALSLPAEGIELSKTTKVLYISPFDFGLGLAILGVRHFFSDPQLSRACLARALGKIQCLLS